MDLSKDRILASMPDEVAAPALEAYRALVARRASGEPVAYLVGHKEFYGRRYAVDSRVLIPRPDTELLVEVALSLLDRAGGGERWPARCHDAFTGSGCVGITLAAERPDIHLSVSDASAGALAVCALNARAILGRGLDARIGNILSAATVPLDLITANPPYVSASFTDGMMAEGSREPRLALDGGEAGLDLYPELVAQAFALLVEGGALAVEIGEEQGPAVQEIFEDAGFGEVAVYGDLGSHDRVVSGVKHAL
jgi:release factor glutamine methyltransferase